MRAVDDARSQSRADAVKVFLEQDVDAWLALYNEQGATKWGSREDRLVSGGRERLLPRGASDVVRV